MMSSKRERETKTNGDDSMSATTKRQRVSDDANVENEERDAGATVWSKLGNFPFWPSRIARLSEVSERVQNSKPSSYSASLVFFFGSGDYAWVPRSRIEDFVSGDEYQSRSAGFTEGVAEALDWSTLAPNERVFPVFDDDDDDDDDNIVVDVDVVDRVNDVDGAVDSRRDRVNDVDDDDSNLTDEQRQVRQRRREFQLKIGRRLGLLA
jgi:PWWP domain